MKKVSLEALARLPGVRRHYKDAHGYAFLNCLEADAEEGWTELTPEEREDVRPLDVTDKRRWEAWHSRPEDSFAQERTSATPEPNASCGGRHDGAA